MLTAVVPLGQSDLLLGLLLRHASISLVTRLACLHTLLNKGLALPLKGEGNKATRQRVRQEPRTPDEQGAGSTLFQGTNAVITSPCVLG